jgi:transposase-like protein
MKFKNLAQAIRRFAKGEDCREYLIQRRCNGKPVCPYCGYGEKIYNIENGKRFKFGSKDRHEKFSVTFGTVFENSNIKLSTWLPAVYHISHNVSHTEKKLRF